MKYFAMGQEPRREITTLDELLGRPPSRFRYPYGKSNDFDPKQAQASLSRLMSLLEQRLQRLQEAEEKLLGEASKRQSEEISELLEERRSVVRQLELVERGEKTVRAEQQKIGKLFMLIVQYFG